MNELKRDLGTLLKNKREELGLSQEKFAEKLGVHPNYIGGLERLERNPTLAFVEKVSAKLGLQPKLVFS